MLLENTTRVLQPPNTGLFDPTVVHQVHLRMTPAALDALRANGQADAAHLHKGEPTENRFVDGALTIDGRNAGAVKLRYKGNYGSLANCFAKISLKQLCQKLSIRVKAGAAAPLPGGIEDINLHAMMNQPSLLGERLGYDAFRAAGIIAPRSVHAFVTINDVPRGIFALTENPDKDYVKARFGSNKGLLYKEVWPNSQDPSFYQRGLETHKKDNPPPRHALMLSLARGVSLATPAARRAAIDQIVGIEQLLRYRVADQLMANWDGITRIFCNSQPPPNRSCNNHNYVWHCDDATARCHLGVWDLDLTWDPRQAPAAWGPLVRGACEKPEVPAACDPMLRTVIDEGRAAFAAVARPLLAGPLSVAQLLAKVDAYAAQIAPAVEKDPTINATAWRAAVTTLRQDIVTLSNRMAAELA